MLEVAKLDAFYGQSHILRGIDFQVAAGESVALLGRNGAGKSTFLKALLNGGPQARGRISFLGQHLTREQLHQRARLGMALVPEDRRIFPKLTVEENIEIGGRAAPTGATPHSINDVVAMLPMCGPLLKRLGFQLSGGQQQMVAIARGIVSRPRLLMLDEPAEGLAPVIVDELADAINRLRQTEGLSLIVTEQNIDFARETTDRLYLLDVGEVVFSGSWPEFDARPDLVDRYLAL
ncbi:ABC transporter ATP-binding protein [Tianweitania sediminis]|uniref:ABC transporter ATP-binding protein n=1 Tax=Tianweitania sediminis TaxID=1502156 RepID=A0A8J7UGL5_9HYPH|nr:ABC transporter ATP-binding protein [Tianweitania sediminis]MBP0438304.1 ABC transporter ATP-binding protein [Tianweitania sediminis]